MATVGAVVVDVMANTARFQSEMNKAASTTVGVVGSIKNSLSNLQGWMAGIGLAVGINEMIAATKEAEVSLSQIDAGLKSTGGAAGLARGELIDLGEDIRRVTQFSDDAALSMEALLLTFPNIKGDVFKDASFAIADMAVRMKQDLSSTALQVGKALNNPVIGMTALQRAGVQFSASQKKVIKDLFETGQVAKAQAIILAELKKEFGGSASAALNTFGEQFNKLIQNIGEEFEMAPSLTEPFKNALIVINDNFETIADTAKATGAVIAGAFAPSILDNAMSGLQVASEPIKKFMAMGRTINQTTKTLSDSQKLLALSSIKMIDEMIDANSNAIKGKIESAARLGLGVGSKKIMAETAGTNAVLLANKKIIESMVAPTAAATVATFSFSKAIKSAGATILGFISPVRLVISGVAAVGAALFFFRDKTIQLGDTTVKVSDFIVVAWRKFTGLFQPVINVITEGISFVGNSAIAMANYFGISFDKILAEGKWFANQLITIAVTIPKTFAVVAQDIYEHFKDAIDKSGALFLAFSNDIAAKNFTIPLTRMTMDLIGSDKPIDSAKKYQELWKSLQNRDWVGDFLKSVKDVANARAALEGNAPGVLPPPTPYDDMASGANASAAAAKAKAANDAFTSFMKQRNADAIQHEHSLNTISMNAADKRIADNKFEYAQRIAAINEGMAKVLETEGLSASQIQSIRSASSQALLQEAKLFSAKESQILKEIGEQKLKFNQDVDSQLIDMEIALQVERESAMKSGIERMRYLEQADTERQLKENAKRFADLAKQAKEDFGVILPQSWLDQLNSFTKSLSEARLNSQLIEDARQLREEFDPLFRLQNQLDNIRLNPFIDSETSTRAQMAALREFRENHVNVIMDTREGWAGAQAALIEYSDAATNAAENVRSAMGDAINNIEDAWVNFVTTGKMSFKSLVDSAIADLARIGFKQTFGSILSSIFPSVGKMFAMPALASGGPATAGKPHIIGEQGPEIYIPKQDGYVLSNSILKSIQANNATAPQIPQRIIEKSIIEPQRIIEKYMPSTQAIQPALAPHAPSIIPQSPNDGESASRAFARSIVEPDTKIIDRKIENISNIINNNINNVSNADNRKIDNSKKVNIGNINLGSPMASRNIPQRPTDMVFSESQKAKKLIGKLQKLTR